MLGDVITSLYTLRYLLRLSEVLFFNKLALNLLFNYLCHWEEKRHLVKFYMFYRVFLGYLNLIQQSILRGRHTPISRFFSLLN